MLSAMGVISKSLRGLQASTGGLFVLYSEGRISEEEALKNADSTNNVRLRIKFAKEGQDPGAVGDSEGVLDGLSLETMEE